MDLMGLVDRIVRESSLVFPVTRGRILPTGPKQLTCVWNRFDEDE